MTDSEKLAKLLNALASWILSDGLTPPPYVQREIDRCEPPDSSGVHGQGSAK